MNKELGECEKEIKLTEIFIRGRVLCGHIVTRVGVSVSDRPDIDRKIRGATTVEEALRKATTEEEVVRVAKEVCMKNNEQKLTAKPPVELKSIEGLTK